eukprot:TRINITY_DN4077_c0_g1_i10.p1 TRINITY_DN4077_c0_g1~~TRINITY_DN4077_c0_g1_i10.p1  ORF type:complete len:107 (-),score=23.34 TRINITY_DN4077_c0_g1_i10:44-364(-)
MKTVIVLLAVIFAVALALGENSRPTSVKDTTRSAIIRKFSDPTRVNGELKCEEGCSLVKRCGPSHCSKGRCTRDYRCKSVCECKSEVNLTKGNTQKNTNKESKAAN